MSEVDTQPVDLPGPSTSTSPLISKAATVTDESEEIAAEAGLSTTNGVNGNGNGTGVEHQEGESRADADGDQNMNGESKAEGEDAQEGDKEEEEEIQDPNRIPDNAVETLYIQNLNEKVRLPVIKETLATLFKPYRPLLPVVAHRNVRMRGQAFISFVDVESANKARKEVNEFPLYGKAMQISFARKKSDVVVQKLEGEETLEEFKKKRLEEKKRTRRDNPLRRKAAAKLKEDESTAPAAKKQRLAMPDEYLPPNSVLFIQNLPEGTTSDDLREVFELHAGLVEIRTIPAKKDIAFVEFADEAAATVAKDALHNFKIDGETKMKVTYARK